jgi:hypothetical protein
MSPWTTKYGLASKGSTLTFLMSKQIFCIKCGRCLERSTIIGGLQNSHLAREVGGSNLERNHRFFHSAFVWKKGRKNFPCRRLDPGDGTNGSNGNLTRLKE